AFLTQVEDQAAAGGGNAAHGFLELGAAVAAQAEQGIAGQALGVHAAQRGLGSGRVAVDEGKVFLAVAAVGKHVDPELPPLGGEPGAGDEGNGHETCGPGAAKKAGTLPEKPRQSRPQIAAQATMRGTAQTAG